MKVQVTDQRVCIKHKGQCSTRRVQIWRFADGTIVLNDGVQRVVQRPRASRVIVSFKAFDALLSNIWRRFSFQLSSL
jgi:hypothetical protein